MLHKTLIATAVATLLATPVLAQPVEDPRLIENVGRALYVAPMLTFTAGDSARAAKVGYGGTLAVGTRLTSFLTFEAQAHYNRFNDKDDAFQGAPTHVTGYGGNLLLFPLSGGFRNTFLLAGASYIEARNHLETAGGGLQLTRYDSTAYELGLGHLSAFNLRGKPAALRLQASYRLDQHDLPRLGRGGEDAFGDVVLSAGVMFPLFHRPPPPAAPPPPPPPPPVAVVPPAPPPPPPPPPPREPEPACVPGGTNGEIDLRACRQGEVLVLRGVSFEFDSDRLTSDARGILDRVADALTRAPDIAVKVGGHTDGRGAVAYNRQLSERRASAVRDHLIAAGVSADRLSAVGYGPSQPLADNDTDAGREINRRVDLTVR